MFRPHARCRGRIALERLEDRSVPAGLEVSITPTSFLENAGANAAAGVVRRTLGDFGQPLTVALSSSDTSEATVPVSVSFAAGQTEATFAVAAVDDALVDGTQTVHVAASATLNGTVASRTSFRAPTFGNVRDVAVQADGKIVAVGGDSDFIVTRYNPDGTLDTTFSGDGIATADIGGSTDIAEAVVIQPDGKIVVGGYGRLNGSTSNPFGIALARFNADGSLDTNFATNGKHISQPSPGFYNEIWDLALAPGGDIIAVGTTTYSSNDMAVFRFSTGGRLNPNFGSGAGFVSTDFGSGERAFGVVIQPDGKIVIAGHAASASNFLAKFGLARYLPSGALDTSFGVGGKVTTDFDDTQNSQFEGANDILLYPDGRLLAVGQVGYQIVGTGTFAYDTALIRYQANGTLDTGFGVGGRVRTNFYLGDDLANDAALQPDGRILIAGGSITDRGFLARFLPNGTLDTSATTQTSARAFGEALALLPDGDVVVGGTAGTTTQVGFLERFSAFTPLSGSTTVDVLDDDGVNRPPVARDDTYETDEEVRLDVAAPGVLGNDSDPDGNPLTAILVTPPSSGNLTFRADGSFSYLPYINITGTVSFTYKVNDGTADSNTATVTINVRPVNDPPHAGNDAYSTDEDTPLNVAAPGVLGNDSDVDSGSLTAVKVSDPTNGTLVFNSNGSFTYTPNANFNGSDSFTYKANDGALDSNTATVRITVRAVNDAPVARDDSYSTNEDTPLNVAAAGVLGNDGDVDSDSLTAVKVTDPANGTLVFNGDGSFTYTPNAHFNGSDSFTYRANDGALDSNTATVTIRVVAVNDAPVARDDSYSTNEDTPLTISAPGVLGNDGDVEGSALTAVKVSNPANGTVTLNADGSFTYTPNANFNGTDSFTYKANDGALDSNTATVTIRVAAVNDAPVARDDSYRVVEEETLRVAAPGVLDNDRDADGDTLRSVLDAGPTNGTLTLAADGSFVYTPRAGFTGTDRFTYRATDGTAPSNVATVVITVAPVAATEGKASGSGRLDNGVRAFEFNVDARLRGGVVSYSGHLRFSDSAFNLDVRSTGITYVRVENDGVRATIRGTATVNGRSGYTFVATVEDRGEPGAGKDTFRLRLSGPDGYLYDSLAYALANGVIEQGNIQVRKRA